MKYRLQNITFEADLLHIKGDLAVADGEIIDEQTDYTRIVLDRGTVFSTDTYFGALSVGKWSEYTGIDNISLHIRTSGEYRLKIYHTALKGPDAIASYDVLQEIWICETFTSDVDVSIPFFTDGLIYFTVDEVKHKSVICDAYYCTDTDISKVWQIKLALNICTYRRTEALVSNVRCIKNELLDISNNSEDFAKTIEVFVTDNASELPCDLFHDDRIHISHNRNLGGAGGFTKGLTEILNRASVSGISHCIFMDDDATISIEGIKRTYYLLRLLKDEYRYHFISGAMNRTEDICIQHENGALWNRGRCIFINRGMDMRDPVNLLINELDYDRDYAAWWYCCVPMGIVREDNLPIPVFIHEDDVEYSLRNAHGIITMNGIAVWHPASAHRRNSVNEYYNLRNLLIVNSKHMDRYPALTALAEAVKGMATALMRHRYKDMRLVVRAVSDYLKGPNWLMQTDAEALNAEIIQMGYSFYDVTDKLNCSDNLRCFEQYDESGAGLKNKWKRASAWGRMALILRMLTLNGWLLPCRNTTELYYMNIHPVELYRCGRIVLFDDTDGKGLVLDKHFGQLFVMLGYTLHIAVALIFRYHAARRSYREAWSELTSMDYWRTVLK